MGEGLSKIKKKIGDGFKASFTRENILSINTAAGTFLITALGVATLFITQWCMTLTNLNPIVTVGIITIWTAFVGFMSVMITTIFGGGSKKNTDENEMFKRFKEYMDNPTEDNLTSVGNLVKGKVEDAFKSDEPKTAILEDLADKIVDKINPETVVPEVSIDDTEIVVASEYEEIVE